MLYRMYRLSFDNLNAPEIDGRIFCLKFLFYRILFQQKQLCLQQFHLTAMELSLPEFFQFKWSAIAIISVLAIALVGWFFIQNNMRRQVVQTRKNWQLLYLYFFISLLLVFISINEQFITALFSAVPLSLLVAAAFLYPEKRWFPLVAHWGLVILSIVILYIV